MGLRKTEGTLKAIGGICVSKLLRKKDFDYFGYFCTIASSATEAANYLHQSLSDFDRETFPAKMDAMHQIENTADIYKIKAGK